MTGKAGELAATVLIPTSIDRGPALRLAVESVLRQTVAELEVFIIGDGVEEVTREAARELERRDGRVRFFDHPKHARRGEPYRDAALREARGRIVCYLCDRDLYLPHHVEEMGRLLADADMACAFPVRVMENGYKLDFAHDLADAEDRARLAAGKLPFPLSFGAHTAEAYRRLPEGWAATPAGVYTDIYFWAKFAKRAEMRLVSGYRPTLLYFPRGSHPGWSTARRLPELERWTERLRTADGAREIEAEMTTAALRDRAARARLLRRWLLVGGEPLGWRWLRRRLMRLVKAVRGPG